MKINDKQIYEADVEKWVVEFPYLARKIFLDKIEKFDMSKNMKKVLIKYFIEDLQDKLDKLEKK